MSTRRLDTTRWLAIGLATAIAAASAPARADDGDEPGSRVQLRPIDRATVRIITVGGAQSTAFESARTGVKRVVAIPRAQHGSGLLVERSGLVLTARHVLWGSDIIAVLLPGTDDPMPARVVFVHPERDVAFLQVDGEIPHHVRLPDAPNRVSMAERISATGYPLDVREPFPAAVAGELSRESRSGLLQVSMSVNQGHSGGPAMNARGELIGILSMRGDPRAGVEGMAFVEPARFVLPAYRRARRARGAHPPSFGEADPKVARVVADFVRTSDEQPIYEQTSIAALREAAAGARDPETLAIIAAHAWNMHIALLEAQRARDASELQNADRRKADALSKLALELGRSALERAPYLRVPYPILRSVVNANGRSFVAAD